MPVGSEPVLPWCPAACHPQPERGAPPGYGPTRAPVGVDPCRPRLGESPGRPRFALGTAHDSRLNTALVRARQLSAAREGMMDVDFYTLERPVQDRFADATRSIGLPTPILHESPKDKRPALWLAGAAVASVALVLSVSRGFGSLASPLALSPLPFAAGFALAVALVAFCVLRALALRTARATLPYQPGLYLFPAGVFDARTRQLRVFRHPELRGFDVGGSTLRVEAQGTEFVFRLPDGEAAERARSALDQARQQYGLALQAQNRREEAMLDPLVDSGFSSPFSPQARLVVRQPAWATLAPVMALLTGVFLGPAIWKARNVASERRLFAAASSAGDVTSYRAYLTRGGPRSEVSDILLPRAELREAVSAGTVEALERYVSLHPASKIQAEVDAAVQAAVRVELAEAQKAGTLTALRRFQERRKRYRFIDASVEASVVAIYKRALAGFMPGKDAGVVSFFERLLGYSKAHGPRTVIRFVRRIPDSVAEADGQVKRSAYFMGKQSIPSQYFTGDYAARRESTAAERLRQELGAPFPADVLSLEVVPAFTEASEPPTVTEPTLLVEYSPEMAGGYMSPKPRGVFVGVGMMFKASFVIPKDPRPLEYKFSLWRTPNAQILKGEGTTVADVYEKMAGDGFERFLKGMLGYMLAK